MTDCNRTNYNRPEHIRPKLHLPLALLAARPAATPAGAPLRRSPAELGRLIAAMVD